MLATESRRKLRLGCKETVASDFTSRSYLTSFMIFSESHPRSQKQRRRQTSTAPNRYRQPLPSPHSTSPATFCATFQRASMFCCTHFNIWRFRSSSEQVASAECGTWRHRAASYGEQCAWRTRMSTTGKDSSELSSETKQSTWTCARCWWGIRRKHGVTFLRLSVA